MKLSTGNFIYDYKRSVKLWELRTTALKDMTYPRFPSQKEETHEHIAFFFPPTSSADNRRRSHGGRPELKSLSVSIFVRAVNIQIILVYISIESPFFKLFKKKKFITMAFVVLAQHMKMFTCASKILLTANFSSIFFSVVLLLLKFLLHHNKDQPFPVIKQLN